MAPWAAFKLGLAEGAGRGIVNGLTIVSFYLVRQGCFGQCVIIPEVDAQGNSMVPKIKHYLLYDAVTSHDGSTKHYSMVGSNDNTPISVAINFDSDFIF
jgi:hypothetical protein